MVYSIQLLQLKGPMLFLWQQVGNTLLMTAKLTVRIAYIQPKENLEADS